MIVDMHRHLASIHERYPQVQNLAMSFTEGSPAAAGVESTQAPSAPERVSEILDEMSGAGVDLSVLVYGDYGLRLGEGVQSVAEENRLQAELAAQHPGALLSFVGVDPRRASAAELVSTAITEWGARGVKLHPATGFYPFEDECLELYKIAGEQEVPVAIHTGPSASPLYSHTAQPVFVDRVAADFPDTNFILQHAGQCWWEEAATIAFCKPNVFLEVSMWQWVWQRGPEEFARSISWMLRMAGGGRVLFGSDFPGLRGAMALDEWVAVFHDLPLTARNYGLTITENDIDGILGKNAADLLRLPT
jgi:predicted TIM-barrel fold metal-dependent hydrolase